MTDPEFSTPPADQPTAPQAPRPEARRSATDRMAGGVCGGLADYSGIDAVLWRVGFVALTLLGGSGVLLYLLLWVLLPPATGADEAQSPLERRARRLHAAVTGSRATPPRP